MAKERSYSFVAVVRRVVLDNVRLNVRATNPIVARDKADKFLESFPDKTDVEGVDYAFIENREHMSAEVLDLSQER